MSGFPSGFSVFDGGENAYLPKSQNAKQTRGSASAKTATSRALYMAQVDAGDPGSGSISAGRIGNGCAR